MTLARTPGVMEYRAVERVRGALGLARATVWGPVTVLASTVDRVAVALETLFGIRASESRSVSRSATGQYPEAMRTPGPVLKLPRAEIEPGDAHGAHVVHTHALDADWLAERPQEAALAAEDAVTPGESLAARDSGALTGAIARSRPPIAVLAYGRPHAEDQDRAAPWVLASRMLRSGLPRLAAGGSAA